MAKTLLHIEGLAVLLLTLFVYQWHDFSWLLFFILLFSPDLSALGYLSSVKLGAILYNLMHTYTFSLAVTMLGYITEQQITFAIGLIFTAHIGLDRLCGFGLKYPTIFKDTHFNRL